MLALTASALHFGKTALYVTAALLAVSLFGTVAVRADRTGVFSYPGTWTIEYFQDAAHTTPWTDYATDGSGVGLPTYPQNGLSPLIGPGDTIYLLITVSGSTASQHVWYEIDGGNAPYPAPADLGTLDGTGSAVDLPFAWTNNLSAAFRANICTVPEKIALGGATEPSSSIFDGNIIDHLLPGSQPGTVCTPPGVPEFPVSIATIVASLVPIAFILRRKIR